jgi:PAS domain S-box-containing protein
MDAFGGDFGEKFRESEQRLQDILDNAPAVVYVKDLEGRYLLINRRYEELNHLSRAQAVGKTDHEIFPKEVADEFRANDELVLGTVRPLVEVEATASADDGTRTYLSLKFPLRDAHGTTYAVCSISTDITARKRTEEALLEVRKAERARMARDLHDGALQDLAYGMAEVHLAGMALPGDLGSAAAALARGSGALRRERGSARRRQRPALG